VVIVVAMAVSAAVSVIAASQENSKKAKVRK
jgi:hypothetical protein